MMASLQSSCTVLAISPFPKASRFLTNPRQSHRSHVSCSGSGSGGGGSIDRRNMLLGLGGLYGASSLISDRRAQADPIKPPDFRSCDTHGAIDGQTQDNLGVNCCPPYNYFEDPSDIPDYEFPAFTRPRIRPAAHLVDKDYLAKYEEAIRLMKALDVTNPNDPRGSLQQANVHCAYCNGPHDQVGHPGVDLQIHGSWLFFPWHRWYLYFYERILGNLIGDDTFALPFWNWDNPAGMDIPEIFDAKCSPLYDPKRNPGHRRPAVADLSGVTYETTCTDLISDNLSIMNNEMISSLTSSLDFFGQAVRDGESVHGPGSVERGSHTGIHRWVGDPREKYHENLGNFYSAGRDPLFFSHHSNVDRLWTVWNTIPTTEYDKTISDTDFTDAAFLFYDENQRLVRVSVANCLDNKVMGYEYQNAPSPWMDYKPPAVAARANVQELSRSLDTADKIFPLTLNKTTRVSLPKTTKGKADEVVVLEDIVTDPTLFVKFDVYINDKDDEPQKVNKAEYAGTYSQLPHKTNSGKTTNSINLSLKALYENIDIADDDTAVVVTIIPRSNGQGITIAGIKIIQATH